MNVILLEKIHKLGDLGEKIDVKAGYGRNYLLPQGKAVIASQENIEYFNEKREELEKIAADKLQLAEQRAAKLNDLSVTIEARVGEEGQLYGSVGVHELLPAIISAGGDVERQEIDLPDGPFRMIGEYDVALRLHHGDVLASVKVSIVAGE